MSTSFLIVFYIFIVAHYLFIVSLSISDNRKFRFYFSLTISFIAKQSNPPQINYHLTLFSFRPSFFLSFVRSMNRRVFWWWWWWWIKGESSKDNSHNFDSIDQMIALPNNIHGYSFCLYEHFLIRYAKTFKWNQTVSLWHSV